MNMHHFLQVFSPTLAAFAAFAMIWVNYFTRMAYNHFDGKVEWQEKLDVTFIAASAVEIIVICFCFLRIGVHILK